jgi:hypothetical protein
MTIRRDKAGSYGDLEAVAKVGVDWHGIVERPSPGEIFARAVQDGDGQPPVTRTDHPYGSKCVLKCHGIPFVRIRP